jgi:hypothetical protein
MTAPRTITTLALAAALTLGCGGGGKIAGFKQGAMPPGFTWDGKYYCDFFGTMQLAQTGSTVVGTVEYGEGRIEGTATGNILRFSWNQKVGPEGLGTQKAVNGRGVFQYVVETSGAGKKAHNVHGVWGYDQEQTGGGKWECYKSKKDVLTVEKQLLVNQEGTVAAAGAETGTTSGGEEEDETTLVGVGAKKKEMEKPTYDTPAPESGDDRLEDLDDLDL